MIAIKIKVSKLNGIDMEQTGKKIKELCHERGITAKMIKEELYISMQSIYAWFSGKTLPSLDNMYLLSRLLGATVDDMIIGTQKEICIYLNMDSMESSRLGGVLLKYCHRFSCCPYSVTQTSHML